MLKLFVSEYDLPTPYQANSLRHLSIKQAPLQTGVAAIRSGAATEYDNTLKQ
jgi:hypothetical protein